MAICEHHDLVKLITLKQNYSDELVLQFYTSVHFSDDDARTMTWMSAGQQCSKTLAEFGALLCYQVQDPDDPGYQRIHAPKHPFQYENYLESAIGMYLARNYEKYEHRPISFGRPKSAEEREAKSSCSKRRIVE